MTDPEKTEDVEEGMDLRGLTAGGIFAKCRQYLDNLRVEMDADDPRGAEVIGATRTLTEILDRFTSLRERLETCRADLRTMSDDYDAVHSSMEAARRADRLEEAGQNVLDERDEHPHRDLSDSREIEGLRIALDSREDEGDDCTCGPPRVSTSGSLGGTLPDVEGRRDPDCPAHADEPEGGEAVSFPDPSEMRGLSEDEAEAYRGIRERLFRGDPPTDEPVSGEGESECSCPPWPTSHPDPACPTHADARSKPIPKKLREWAQWFDNPNEAPGFAIAPPRPSTPGMVLRQIADGFERRLSDAPSGEGERDG